MNPDELKLIVKILADQSKAQKDIDKTVVFLQSYISKNKSLKIHLQTDDKSIKKALKDQLDAVGQSNKLKLGTDLQTFLNENPRVLKLNSDRVNELRKNINDINSKTDLRKIRAEFGSFKSEMKSTGLVGRNFSEELVHNLKKVGNWMLLAGGVASAIRQIKQMVTNVVELDSSLVELSKVSDLSSTSLEKFTQRAFEAGAQLGRTGKEVIDAVTVFKRAGYTLNESFELGKAALLTTNIGDGIKNVEEASSALIAVLKGFQMDDSEVLKIVDAINETSNNAAIDFQNITEGLRRVSGTLGQTGSSLEQTIGMLTGGFGQLRDIEMVSSGLVMISQRLRGINEDGEAIEGLAPKLQKAFKEIAGIDIEDSNGELRSTYDILSDMARVFPTLSSKQQQYLGEMASGNRQVKVLNSILQGWQDVEQAVESATNSQGSSYEENQKYLDSIQGKLSQFESSFQKLSSTVVDSDLIKMLVDIGTLLNNIIESLMSNFGAFNTMLLVVISILGVKGFAVFKNLSHLIVGSLIPALTGATTSSLMLASAMQVIAPIAIFTSIVGLVKLIDHFTTSLKEQREEVETLSNSIESLNTEYQALSQKQSLTEAEEKRLELLKAQIEANKILLQQEAQKLYEAEKVNAPSVTEIMNNPYTGEMSNRDAIQQAIDEYAELNEVTDETLAKQDETIAKRAELIKTFTEEAKRLQDLKDAGAKLDATDEQRLTSLYDIISAYNEQNPIIDDATDSIDNLNEATSALLSTIESFADKQSLVSSALDEINESNKLSFDTIQKLLKAYPQLDSVVSDYLAGLASTSDVMTAVNEAYDTDLKNYKDAIIEKQKLDDTFYSNTLSQSAKKVNAFNDQYGVDLSNYKNLAEAKLEVEKILIGDLARLWSQYYDSTSGAFNQQYDDLVERAAMGDRAAGVRVAKLDKIMSQRDAMISALDEIAYGGIDVSLGKAGKSSSSSISKSTDPWKALHDAYDKRLKLSKEYIEDRNFYNDWGADNEIASLERIKAYTEQYYRDGKISYEKYAEVIRDINKSIYSARKQIEEQARETFSTIADIEGEIVKLYERKFDKLKDQLQDWYESRKNKAEEDYNNQKQQYNNDLDAFKKYINDKKDLLNDQYDEDTFNKDLSEKQKELTEIQSKINELSLAVASGDRFAKVKKEELLIELANRQSDIDKLVSDRSRTIQLDALDNALTDYEDYIDDKQDILDTNHKNEISKLDSLYSKKLKNLEREYSKEKLYSDARQMLMSGEYSELMAMFEEYKREQGEGWSSLGSILQSEFINRLKEAKNLLIGFSDSSIDVSVGDNKKPNTGSGDSDRTIDNGDGTSIAYTSDGIVFTDNNGKKWIDKGRGWQEFANGGLVNYTGIAKVHGTPTKPEGFLKNDDLNKLLRVVDISRNITKNLISPINTNAIPKLNSNITIDKLVNIEGNVRDDSLLLQIKKSTDDSLKELAKLINGSRTTISGFST